MKDSNYSLTDKKTSHFYYQKMLILLLLRDISVGYFLILQFSGCAYFSKLFYISHANKSFIPFRKIFLKVNNSFNEQLGIVFQKRVGKFCANDVNSNLK